MENVRWKWLNEIHRMDNYLEREQQDEDKADQTVQPQFRNFHMRCAERNHQDEKHHE